MPLALKVLLQLAVRDIGQLTDIESRRALAGALKASVARDQRASSFPYVVPA
jgi:hypothetical protein